MAKRKQQKNWAKQRSKKRKRKIGHAPKTTAAYKKSFLAKLEQGIAPRYAAKLAHIARSTIYHWKREDPAFAKAWEEAVQVGVDLVETRLVQRALKTSDSTRRDCAFAGARLHCTGGGASDRTGGVNDLPGVAAQRRHP